MTLVAIRMGVHWLSQADGDGRVNAYRLLPGGIAGMGQGASRPGRRALQSIPTPSHQGREPSALPTTLAVRRTYRLRSSRCRWRWQHDGLPWPSGTAPQEQSLARLKIYVHTKCMPITTTPAGFGAMGRPSDGGTQEADGPAIRSPVLIRKTPD